MNFSKNTKAVLAGVTLAILAAGAANAQPSATRVNKHVSVSTAMLLDGTALQTVITHDDQAFGQSGEGFATVHCEGAGTPDTPKWSCKPIATAFVAGKGMAQDLLQEVIHSTGFVVGLHNQAVEKIIGGATSFNVNASNAPISATGGNATGGTANSTGGNATGGNSSATGGSSNSSATGGTGVGGTAVSNSSAGANSDSAGNTSVAVSGSSSSSTADANANNTGSNPPS